MHNTAAPRYAACSLILLCICCTRQDTLELARGAENRGQYDEALALYTQLLAETVESRALPERRRAATADVGQFAEEIARYMDWARRPGAAVESSIVIATAAIARCGDKARPVTGASRPALTRPSPAEYRALWQQAFYPDFLALHDKQEPLIGKAFEDGFSFVRVSSRKSYSYECLLLEERSWRATSFSLYFEDTQVLPARPGNYLLLARGSTRFASGGSWTAPWVALPVLVPDQASLLSLTLHTTVTKN